MRISVEIIIDGGIGARSLQRVLHLLLSVVHFADLLGRRRHVRLLVRAFAHEAWKSQTDALLVIDLKISALRQ